MGCRYVVIGVRAFIDDCRSSSLDESADARSKQSGKVLPTKGRIVRREGKTVPRNNCQTKISSVSVGFSARKVELLENCVIT